MNKNIIKRINPLISSWIKNSNFALRKNNLYTVKNFSYRKKNPG